MRKTWQHMRHDWHMYWCSWRIQLRAATKLRGAVVLQTVGMIINNLGLMGAWLFLFSRFGSINGWTAADYVLMQGVNMIIFGGVVQFNVGLFELARYVDQGTFDIFLTKPSSILMQVASSSFEVASFGDLTLGVGIIGWYILQAHIGLVPFLAFLLALIIGMIIMWCFILLPFLLAFYLFDSDKVARAFVFFFYDGGIYPTGVIGGALRGLFLTAWPTFFIGAVPVDIIRGLNGWYLQWGLVLAVVWLSITLILFRKSLRKYESANLVGAR